MSSKELKYRNNKGRAKLASSKKASGNLNIVAQQQPRQATIIQRAKLDPGSLTRRDVLQLQRTIGNQAVGQLLNQTTHHQLIRNEQIKTCGTGNLQAGAVGAGLQRSRELPKELQDEAKSGDRARTLEETIIDVVGTGSALNSLVTSPFQTVANAVTGLFSGFPSRARIRQQAVVKNAINTAWTAATADYSERFGWITWDKNTDTYAVPAVSVGTPYSVTPPPKPADPAPGAANQVFHVGEFHLHPPLDPGDPAMANPRDFPIGPSKEDEQAAQDDNSPGIVRDFDTIDRTGSTTDYTYGPWTRTE